jgi:dipeptidase
MKKILILLSLIFIQGFILAQDNEITENNCYTIIVGKNASYDGSVLLGHNEDDNGDVLVNLHKVPSLDYKKDSKITLLNGKTIPQPPKTNGYIWIQVPGQRFADSYMNEFGVTICSNGCQSKEENTNGEIGYFLRKIIAERANTAKDAVKIAGKLIETLGYDYSGRTYSIADPNESWVLAVVKGKQWLAQRVPDDEVAIIPNYYTIKEINLKDTTNYLASKEIISYAKQNNWYNESGGEFNFRNTYSSIKQYYSVLNIARHWKGINLLSEKIYGYNDDFPFSFKPKKKVTKEDIKQILSNHYEKTDFEANSNFNNGNPHKNIVMRICNESTQYSFIAQLKSNEPKEFNNILWFAPLNPCVNPYIPIYYAIDSFPGGFSNYHYTNALDNQFVKERNEPESNNSHNYYIFIEFIRTLEKDYNNISITAKSLKNNLEKEIESKVINLETLFKSNKYDDNYKKREIYNLLDETTNEWLRNIKSMISK